MGKSYKKNEVRNTDKGIRYEVMAFKNKKEIEKIKQFLLGKRNKRDYALFVLGINIGLRTQDLLTLKIKDVCKELNIKGNYGAHSLRKTFGYWVYVSRVQQNPLVLVTLQKMFNHSTQATTLRYIGIDSTEISNIYQNLNI